MSEISTEADGDTETIVVPLEEEDPVSEEVDGPVDAAGARKIVLAQLEEAKRANATKVDPQIFPGRFRAGPATYVKPKSGTANVRIRDGFSTDTFIISQLELELTQQWQNVPLDKLAEIHEIANNHQVPLEVDEAAE
jgi:hypothetical protein